MQQRPGHLEHLQHSKRVRGVYVWIRSCPGQLYEQGRLLGLQTRLAAGAGMSRFAAVTEAVRLRDIDDYKARRRAALATIGDYHEQQLRLLLEHVRHGFEQLDAGEIDPFELDNLIHRYKRSAQRLWSFCSGSERDLERAALRLESERDQGEPDRDWWEAGAPRRRP